MENREVFQNSKRFIDAYNNIDYALKTRYNLNRAMGFSDLIRKSVSMNYVVRKYEDDLIDYGRLRNAIVHNNNEDFVIAEPHDSVVENIEHIGRDISVVGEINGTKEPIKIIVSSELAKKCAGKEILRFKAKRIYVFEETGERIL